MIWTILKWVITPLLLVAVVLALIGRETFHVEVTIPAPPEEVWAVLMDTSAYGDWNPVFTKVEGEYNEGANIRNTVQAPDGQILDIETTVKVLNENRELRQTGGMTGLLTFDHQWLLESVEGGTRVTQHEIDQGLYMWFWDSGWIEPSYAKVSEALRDRIASINH
ncbi:SRPBCC family protein [Hoeflea sp. TYP-13]|uniref:SRPBCC family protein n=1 Tax=Hoeflea sp. TYP-13 TaxID=3230023 RepID=UPI0034C6DB05